MANGQRFFLVTVLSMLTCNLLAEPFPEDAQVQLQDFCRRFSHRTAIISNRLYIDGGFVNFNPLDQNPTNYTNTDLFYADLLNTTEGMPTMMVPPKKNATVPSVAGGTLWADWVNNVFYAFGGYFPDSSPLPFVTWLYNVAQESWTSVSTRGDSTYVAYGMAAIAADAGVGYYLGGYHDNQTQNGWSTNRLYTSNLVAFDMNTRTYTNTSGPDDQGRGEGLSVFIPASTSGLLIFFGGVIQDPSTGETSGASMAEIGIYDIATSQWYIQNATGEVPEQRTRFCGGATWPEDKSSFNIYIYGGLRPNGVNINGSTAFDDLYILTLPAFVWIKWYPISPGTSYPHHSLTCDIINGTQMIVMGGTFPNSSQCDVPVVYGMHNANLAQNNPENAEWIAFTLNFPPYTVPPAIISVVGGTSKGGANVTQPVNSSASYDYYLFQRPYKVTTRSPTPTTSSSLAASTSTSTSNLSRGALIGAIVGAVISGILLSLAALGGFVLFQKSRKPQADTQQEMTEQDKMVDDRKGKGTGAAAELEAEQMAELPNGQQDARELWSTPVELPADTDETSNGP